MNLLDKLNPMQKQAVTHTEGPLLILAGAGSGKTRVLTHRIAYLIENGISPYNILAITFTNKAAREMKERVSELVGSDQVWVSTFHSSCVRILRGNINSIGYDNSFSIYDSDDSLRLLKQCIKELNINEKQFPPKAVAGIISAQKDELVGAEEYAMETAGDFRLSRVSKIYSLYQKKLKKSNALDFDDLIFMTVKLFRTVPEVLEKYGNRFKYVMVDEYQDTNAAQYELVKLLSKKHNNLCVVGDDDQSIYGWRGANINNILGFEKDFKNAAVIKLEENYRSTQNILDAANAVIANNLSRKSKSLWTQKDSGKNINFCRAANDIEEARFICQSIADYKSGGGSYSHMAVLYRQNSLSRSIEDQLVKSGVPYKIYGGIRFYDRKEIKDILAYLRAMYNPFDDVAFHRIVNTPKRGIGDSTVAKISAYATENELSLFDAMRNAECLADLGQRARKIRGFVELMEDLNSFAINNNVTRTIEYMLDSTGYLLELKAEATDESQGRIENIGELINKAHEFEEASEDKTLPAFLEEVSLVADIDTYNQGEDCVSLMTLHSSKGLEFPVVFIAGFEETIFPSYRSVFSGELKDLEEERRLCYVGITRAKEALYITCTAQRLNNGKVTNNAPSRFLKEIPESYISKDVQSLGMGRGVSPRSVPEKKGPPTKPKFTNNYAPLPKPRNVVLDFGPGDRVKQARYGEGLVKEVKPAGADFEVTVEFEGIGVKKFMAHFSNLKKVE